MEVIIQEVPVGVQFLAQGMDSGMSPETMDIQELLQLMSGQFSKNYTFGILKCNVSNVITGIIFSNFCIDIRETHRLTQGTPEILRLISTNILKRNYLFYPKEILWTPCEYE